MRYNAYGLSKDQRETIVKMAKSGLYYERYISNMFNISDVAVRDICAKMGNYVCKRLDENLKHHDGYDLSQSPLEKTDD